MDACNFRNLGRVLHAYAHFKFRLIFFSIQNLHPRFCRLAHGFHRIAVHAVRDNLGHTVNHFQVHIGARHVCYRHTAQQTGQSLSRQGFIFGFDFIGICIFLNFQAVHANCHCLLLTWVKKRFRISAVNF